MIGFVAGSFDLLHAGHILMFQEAKTVCDYLIVGLQTDPSIDRPEKNKPIQSIVERQIQLKGCKYVDEIIVYETEQDLLEILMSLDIDVRINGGDHERKSELSPRDIICHNRNIKIYYCKRDHGYSTTNLRNKLK
jgi:glycerol-3-phosphate cytidylyltransferase